MNDDIVEDIISGMLFITWLWLVLCAAIPDLGRWFYAWVIRIRTEMESVLDDSKPSDEATPSPSSE